MVALLTGLPRRRAYVRKTGLPFYDAARVWGVSRLLFGQSTCTVMERADRWELEGYAVNRAPEHTVWLRTRLTRRGLERIEDTTLQALDRLASRYNEVVYYFTNSGQQRHFKADTDVSRYLEPAWLQASRGYESWNYRSLASSWGKQVREPYAEVVSATAGICLAGLGTSGKDRLLLLPIPDVESSRPVALGPFLQFDYELQHRAGGIVGPVALALHILRQIGDLLPVREFAFTRFHGRAFNESGYLGLGSVLLQWQRDADPKGPVRRALMDIGHSLFMTRYQDDPATHNLARAQAMFVYDPTLVRLEELLKERIRHLWGNSPSHARFWADADTMKGVLTLASVHVDVPEQLRRLAANVAGALLRVGKQQDGEQGKGDGSLKGVAGWYTRLEYAPTAERFFREIERLMTRAMMAGDASWYRTWSPVGGWEPMVGEWTGRRFREMRTAFLLEVQRELVRAMWDRSKADVDAGGTPEAMETVENGGLAP